MVALEGISVKYVKINVPETKVIAGKEQEVVS